MKEDAAIKRRAVLEKELDKDYLGKLVSLPGELYGRIENIGVEWQGSYMFEVIVHVGNKRLLFELTDFKTHTKILR